MERGVGRAVMQVSGAAIGIIGTGATPGRPLQADAAGIRIGDPDTGFAIFEPGIDPAVHAFPCATARLFPWAGERG